MIPVQDRQQSLNLLSRHHFLIPNFLRVSFSNLCLRVLKFHPVARLSSRRALPVEAWLYSVVTAAAALLSFDRTNPKTSSFIITKATPSRRDRHPRGGGASNFYDLSKALNDSHRSPVGFVVSHSSISTKTRNYHVLRGRVIIPR